MNAFAIVLALFIIISACTHGRINEDIDEKTLDAKTHWSTNYLKAQTEHSCALFTELSLDKRFPLHQVAYLHAIETCDIYPLVQEVEPALKDFEKEVQLKRAIKINDLHLQTQLLLEKTRQNLPAQKRIELLHEVLRLAELTQNKKALDEAQKRLFRLSPKLNPEADPLSNAEDLKKHRDYSKAITVYNQLLADSKNPQRLQALKGLRQTYKLMHDKAKVLQISKEMVVFANKKLKPKNLEAFHNTMLDVARVYWTYGQGLEAEKLLSPLKISDAYLVRGRIAEEKNDFVHAHEFYSKALEFKNSNSNKARLMWLSGWVQRKLGKFTEAALQFEQLKIFADQAFFKNRASFWLAESLKASGDNSKSTEEFTTLAQQDKFGYYGLLAARALKKPIARPKPLELRSENFKDLHKKLDWLYNLNESALVKKYLDVYAENLRAKNTADAMIWMELFNQYLRAQDFTAMNEQLLKLAPALRAEITEKDPELMFPTPYKEIVAKASTRFGVTKELIYSIMRQESSFDPNVRSSADALGLMQLLPEVAKNFSDQVGFKNAEDLFDPKVNIQAGAAYLKQLLFHYQGQFVLVAANYNTAEEAIQSWFVTRYHGDTLEFIEDIPYEETRGYIRLVMRNLIVYSLKNSTKDEIDFPEWVLSLTSNS